MKKNVVSKLRRLFLATFIHLPGYRDCDV